MSIFSDFYLTKITKFLSLMISLKRLQIKLNKSDFIFKPQRRQQKFSGIFVNIHRISKKKKNAETIFNQTS